MCIRDSISAGARAGDLESETLEIKQEARTLKETLELLADAVVCLANTRGGHLIVGVVDDVAGSGALVGVDQSLTADVVAVSYTHLDVYKRQVHDDAGIGVGTKWMSALG